MSTSTTDHPVRKSLCRGHYFAYSPRQLWVGNGLLPKREFPERQRVKPSVGDRRATSAFWNLFRIVASAVSDGKASVAVSRDAGPERQLPA